MCFSLKTNFVFQVKPLNATMTFFLWKCHITTEKLYNIVRWWRSNKKNNLTLNLLPVCVMWKTSSFLLACYPWYITNTRVEVFFSFVSNSNPTHNVIFLQESTRAWWGFFLGSLTIFVWKKIFSSWNYVYRYSKNGKSSFQHNVCMSKLWVLWKFQTIEKNCYCSLQLL